MRAKSNAAHRDRSRRAARRGAALRGGAGPSALLHALVLALAELLDDLVAEGGQVVGIAARDEALVHVHLLVDPVAARVADVGLERGERRERAALHDVGLHERPRPVAD